MAYKASSRRSETPNLSKMLCRWFFTVCSLINIFSAISLFLKPCATKATISRSLWLSRERSRSRLLETGVPAAGASSAPVANCRMTAAVVCESSQISPAFTLRMLLIRSEERRVGQEGRRVRIGRGCTGVRLLGGAGGGLQHDGGGGVRIQPDFAGIHFADALDQQIRGALFQDDAAIGRASCRERAAISV